MWKLRRVLLYSLYLLVQVLYYAACGGSSTNSSSSSNASNSGSNDNFKAVMVSDTGGIDDKSFNQGAWEGLLEWGKNNGGKTKGNGVDYILSKIRIWLHNKPQHSSVKWI